MFGGRDFMHWRDVLGQGQNSTNILLHFVREDFPQTSCRQILRWKERAMSFEASATKGTNLAQLARPRAVDPQIDHDCYLLNKKERSDLAAWRRSGAVSSVLSGYVSEAEEWLELSEARRAKVGVDNFQHSNPTDTGGAFARAAAAAPKDDAAREPNERTRYMLYSPCVTVSDAEYCNQQFNNQMQQMQHALAVATALRRVLVLPPLLWMSHQDAEQQLWFPASHFINVTLIAQNFAVIEWAEFLELEGQKGLEGNVSTVTIPYYLMPPYVIPRSDKLAYGGHFFRRNGLRWCSTRRMSPFYEVKQASSGRGGSAFVVGEGASYWRAAALLMPRHNTEMRDLLLACGAIQHDEKLPVPNCEELEAELINHHAMEIMQWRTMGAQFPRLHSKTGPCDGVAGENDCKCSHLDVVAFDFAPSFNFKVDSFDFDPTLQRVRSAIRFTDRLQVMARDLARTMFGTSDVRFGAIHLRRDGYELFCFGRGLQYYKGKRFGYQVTDDMCFPSIAQVAAFANRAMSRHGVEAILLATNSRNSQELAELRQALAVPFHRASEMFTGQPEHLPLVEQLLCAQAVFFIGNVASTFTATVVHERDLREFPRDTFYTWGNEDGRTAPAEQHGWAVYFSQHRRNALLLIMIWCISCAILLLK